MDRSMKSLVSMVLIASVIPVNAAQTFGQPSDPIGRAIAREAVALAAEQGNDRADREWSRVTMISPGTKLNVTFKGLRSNARGFVVRVDATTLWLKTNGVPLGTPLARADVFAVRRVIENDSVRKGALIGLAAGTAFVFLLLVAPHSSPDWGLGYFPYAWIRVAPITTGVGALIGKASSSSVEELIYQAP